MKAGVWCGKQLEVAVVKQSQDKLPTSVGGRTLKGRWVATFAGTSAVEDTPEEAADTLQQMLRGVP